MAINKVEFGGQTLIDLTADTITTADLMQNKTAHDKAGNSIKGAFTLDTELTAQDAKISAIKEALKGKGACSKPVIKPLNVTSNGTYNAPSGTDGYNPVNVNCPMPKAEQVKTVDITENGTVSIKPDAGKTLLAVTVNTNVPTGGVPGICKLTFDGTAMKAESFAWYTNATGELKKVALTGINEITGIQTKTILICKVITDSWLCMFDGAIESIMNEGLSNGIYMGGYITGDARIETV